jgi:hypothetical protein
LLFLACTNPTKPAPTLDQLLLTETNIPTVFQASWQSEPEGRGKVEYGPTKDYGYGSQLGELSTEHSALIFAVPPGESWHWRAVVELEDGSLLYSEDALVTGGEIPRFLPKLSLSGLGDPDTLLLFSVVNSLYYVMVDGHGRYRWWISGEAGDFYSLRAMLSLDKSTVLYQQVAKSFQDPGSLSRVSLSGELEQSLTLPPLSHDFVETPYGLATIAYESRNKVRGDTLLEIEADGQYTSIFSTWDHFDPATTGDPGWDWSHANSLDWDGERYLLGLRNFGSILAISREGELEWGFSGDANQFSFTEGSGFKTQHQFALSNNQLLVYVNTWPDPAETSVAAWQVDEEAKTASPLWRYTREPELNTRFYGGVVPMKSGEMLVAWGNKGQLEWVSADRQQQWRLEVEEQVGYPEVLRLTENGLEVLGI